METDEDLIWNRAALDAGGTAPREGDRALAALLRAHGMVMNGGVGHAIEVLSRDELLEAVAGFRFFGFQEVAALLENAATHGVDDEEVADSGYARFIPNDDTITRCFSGLLRARREAFAPA
jgi:hypothetical protein